MGNILPDCQTLVMVPSAGIPAIIRLPEAAWASCSVGSSHISCPRLHWEEFSFSEWSSKLTTYCRTCHDEAKHFDASVG